MLAGIFSKKVPIYSDLSRIHKCLFVAVLLFISLFLVIWKTEFYFSPSGTNMPSAEVYLSIKTVFKRDHRKILKATCRVTFSRMFNELPWEYKVMFRKDDCSERNYGYYHLYTHPSMVNSKLLNYLN